MELMLSRGVCACLESAMALWRCGYALCVILSSNISVFDMVTSTHAHRSANIVHPTFTLFRIAMPNCLFPRPDTAHDVLGRKRSNRSLCKGSESAFGQFEERS